MSSVRLAPWRRWLATATFLRHLDVSALRAVHWVCQYSRFTVLEILEQEGLFHFLDRPRSRREVFAHFGFVDDDYSRLVFRALLTDPEPVLQERDGKLCRTPLPLPAEAEIHARIAAPYRLTFLREFARHIPERLRGRPAARLVRLDDRPARSRITSDLQLRLYQAGHRAALVLLGEQLARGGRMLELGCGGGRETAELWRSLAGRVEILAGDASEAMVATARDSFPRLIAGLNGGGAKNPLPEFRVLDAEDLDLPDADFDFVFCSNVLHWLAEPPRGLREIARVLKPRGVVFGSQPVLTGADAAYNNALFRATGRSHGFPSPDGFAGWLRAAGLRPLRIPGRFTLFAAVRSPA